MLRQTTHRIATLVFALALMSGVAGIVYAQDTDPNFDEMQLQRSENTATLVDGEGKDVVEANCLACHTAQPIITHDGFTADTWVSIVAKMRNTYGAEITDEDAAIITAYLVWHYSDEPPSAENQLLNGMNTEEEDPVFDESQATPAAEDEATPQASPAD